MKDKGGVDINVDDDKSIADNLLKLNVFYRELGYKEIIEKPRYEVQMQKCISGGSKKTYWTKYNFSTTDRDFTKIS